MENLAQKYLNLLEPLYQNLSLLATHQDQYIQASILGGKRTKNDFTIDLDTIIMHLATLLRNPYSGGQRFDEPEDMSTRPNEVPTAESASHFWWKGE